MEMPVIPWIGGKRRLADVLISRVPSLSTAADNVG